MITTQPVRFLLVGAGGYVVNLTSFALLDVAGVPYVGAAIASYMLSNALMYLGNRYFTFRLGQRGFWAAYLRYVLVGGIVAGGNALLLIVLVELARLSPRTGLALALLLITPVSFVLNRQWTFQSEMSVK